VFPRSSTADGVPDGGWWPRSRDPATELPTLIAAVTDRLNPVRRITLNASAWDGRPNIIMTVEGGEVRLDWFGAPDAHTISLIGSRRSRLDLTMVPPDTATILALVCLAIAAGAPTPHRPIPRPAEPDQSTAGKPTVGASETEIAPVAYSLISAGDPGRSESPIDRDVVTQRRSS
jgi:hypothetical protein